MCQLDTHKDTFTQTYPPAYNTYLCNTRSLSLPPTYLPTSPTYLVTYLPTHLPTHPPTYPSANLPTAYLPTHSVLSVLPGGKPTKLELHWSVRCNYHSTDKKRASPKLETQRISGTFPPITLSAFCSDENPKVFNSIEVPLVCLLPRWRAVETFPTWPQAYTIH